MRKLLVASQKGGVGKTTTSINLAAAVAAAGGRVLLLDADPLSNVSTALRLSEHPDRRSLRQTGCRAPGILVPDVLPGLDVLSPYEDGSCSDDDFEQLLQLLAAPECRAGYDCLIVDTPPFLGAQPPQLLSTCDEYVLVMSAEANAHMTLPAFQELVQRSKRGAKPAQMLGIVLTLPEGEAPGGRWERELRGRLGTRILPDAIPFDPAAAQARDEGQVLVHAAPDALAARQYTGLVDNLCLTPGPGRGVGQTGGSPLLRAAAAFGSGSVATECVDLQPPAAVGPDNTPMPLLARRAPSRTVRRPAPRPEPAEEPDLPMDAGSLMSMPEIPVLRLNRPLPRKPAGSSGPRRAVPPRSSEAAAKKPKLELPPPQGDTSLWLWVGVATVSGFVMRFFAIPPRLAPLFIGAGVAAAMLLLLRVLLTPVEAAPPVAPSRKVTPRPTQRTAEPRKEVNARLAALTRRPGAKQ